MASTTPPDRSGSIPIDARINRASGTVHLSITRATDDGKTVAADDLPLRVYLNDAMLDLDAPVRVVCNGRRVYDGIVSRRVVVMLRSLSERGDPSYLFSGEVVIPIRSAD